MGFTKHDGVYVDGPIRWYEYCPYNNWIMTGLRPYGVLGAIDLAFTPRYWFWYGHTGSNEYKYECEFLDSCEECEKTKLYMVEKYKEWYPDETRRKEELLKRYGIEDLLVHPKKCQK